MTPMRSFIVTFLWLSLVKAHLGAFHPAMYCLNGAGSGVDLNCDAPVAPLYQLSESDWWMHHINGCDEHPPAPGVFLDLPAGGQFEVEIASNRAKTTLSYNGKDTSEWPDGAQHPEDYHDPNCIGAPNMHTQNQSMAAGTAFAISYQSDIKQVTKDNLIVFSVRYHTPWKRVTSYDVPAAMPECPPGGCICAWGWVPNGCGQPNMYMFPYRCRVTNAKCSAPLAKPQPPVWCEGNPNQCTKGAKQMIYWNQLEGNNIQVDGNDNSGHPKSPAYNDKCGFKDGAQNDIFVGSPQCGGNGPNPVPSSSSNSFPSPNPNASPSSVPGPSPSVSSSPGTGYSSELGDSTVSAAPSGAQTLDVLANATPASSPYAASATGSAQTCHSESRRSRAARMEAKRSSHSYQRRNLHKKRMV